MTVQAGLAGSLRRFCLGISEEEASFSRRRFPGAGSPAQEHLEAVGRAFVHGYNLGLETTGAAALGRRLDVVDPERRGFAYEGAAMALGLLDALLPPRRRWSRFLQGAGAPHVYMVHVGVGWAWARLPGAPERRLARLDGLLGWLAVDGYGFHEGYFHWPRTVAAHGRPRGLSPAAAAVFDQGLGRSLWFVEGADVERIARTVASFPEARRGDLWSGVGLAAAYAGGVTGADLTALRTRAGEHALHAAQGAAFAARARLTAGNLAPHTETACRILCGHGATEAARVADEALAATRRHPPGGEDSGYAAWRAAVRSRLRTEVVAA
jgi:hypothetical protein